MAERRIDSRRPDRLQVDLHPRIPFAGIGDPRINKDRQVGRGQRLGQLGQQLVNGQRPHARRIPGGHCQRGARPDRVVAAQLVAVADHQREGAKG